MKNKGITLIALVITIVVLIILAAVAINLSLGNNGIFNRAKTAKEQYSNAQDYEEVQSSQYGGKIDNYVKGARDDYDSLAQRVADLESKVTVLQHNSPNNFIILKRDFGAASTALGNNSSKQYETIKLDHYGTGKAIIYFTVRGENKHTAYISAWINKNNNTSSFDSDSVNDTASMTNSGCSLSNVIEYDENTVIGLGIYTSIALTPYYGYSVLIMPD